MRLALGSSRKHLIAQAISEAAPVLTLGGVLGVILAAWAVDMFVASAPAGLARAEYIELSAPIIALGATRRNVSRLVVWQGVSMAVLGSIVGLALAIAAIRIMANVVYGVAPTDITNFLGATTLLLLVAALASYVPSRRAAAIDPAVILRAE